VTDRQARLDFDAGDPGDPLEARDLRARALAVDPTRNVALEASAGTGKTRVLVERYVRLLTAGVKPRNILAMTFTRKAAAEMRQRILQALNRRHSDGSLPPGLWREIRDSITDISISTIDAFCLALLREFPLEADVDPGFELADETETPRLVNDALERTLRAGRRLAIEDAEIALLFAELGEFRLREGLARLLDRRLVAWDALGRFLQGAAEMTLDEAVRRLHVRLRNAFASVPGGADGLTSSGPVDPDFVLLASGIRELVNEPPPAAALTQALLERVSHYLLTQDGAPRKRLSYKKIDFRSSHDYERHAAAVTTLGPYVVDAIHAYRHDINLVLARAVRRLFAIAVEQYGRTLRTHGVLDFSDVLQRTLVLLAQMDEFSRSRFKLEARYQHVLVDEFQDTSRAQWQLVELLVRSWAAGVGVSEGGLEPSIFIVGDRKQSIYAFRDAEVAVLDAAARYIEALRPVGQVRTAISKSFRSVRELLAFANDLFDAIDKVPGRPDAFRYAEDDLFPLRSVEASEPEALGIVAAASDETQAEIVADEIARLLISGAPVRDRDSGERRSVRPGDIAVLFRSREGHRLFEDALARRRVPYYVYKGLGFFDADEIKDVLALLRFLARPESELAAAALLRSRFIHLSDEALKLLAPSLSAALLNPEPLPAAANLSEGDRRRLRLARDAAPRWLALVDRLSPSELLDRVLAESAYAVEIGGPSYRQSRENLKKVRALVRRIQNRGYATLARIVDHLGQLAEGGDESNAIVDAVDAVNLMTAHAAKGLEFPIVFVVNIHRGSGGSADPIRVWPAPFGSDDTMEPSIAIGEHKSDADRDIEARDAEENKRLLYVACTRARDRLYLAATLNAEGRFMPGRGGLGRTLPSSFAALFSSATAATERITQWDSSSGSHRFRVVKPSAERLDLAVEDDSMARRDDFSPLMSGDSRRTTATALSAVVSPVAREEQQVRRTFRESLQGALETGTLVHRALEARVLTLDQRERRMLLEELLRNQERILVDDAVALVDRTDATLERLLGHAEIAEMFDESSARVSWRRYEVPFSLRAADGTLVRGSIDCVIRMTTGDIEVLEFKTGQRVPEHERQLDVYVEAARALFPEAQVVHGRLIYADS